MSKAHEKDIRQQTRQTSFSSHIAFAYPSIEGRLVDMRDSYSKQLSARQS